MFKVFCTGITKSRTVVVAGELTLNNLEAMGSNPVQAGLIS